MMAFEKSRDMSECKVQYDIPKHGLDWLQLPLDLAPELFI